MIKREISHVELWRDNAVDFGEFGPLPAAEMKQKIINNFAELLMTQCADFAKFKNQDSFFTSTEADIENLEGTKIIVD